MGRFQSFVPPPKADAGLRAGSGRSALQLGVVSRRCRSAKGTNREPEAGGADAVLLAQKRDSSVLEAVSFDEASSCRLRIRGVMTAFEFQSRERGSR